MRRFFVWCGASLMLPACAPTETGPALAVTTQIVDGTFRALVDGGDALFGLDSTTLRVFARDRDLAELGRLDLPIPGPQEPHGALLLQGDVLYASSSSSLWAIDVGDRASPTLLFHDATFGAATLALVSGQLWASSGSDITVFDISDPTAWQRVLQAGVRDAPTPPTTTGPDVMVVADGLAVLVEPRVYRVAEQGPDWLPVPQPDTGAAPLDLTGLLGVIGGDLYACERQRGLVQVALDDGVLGGAEDLDTAAPCTGRKVGDDLWLGFERSLSVIDPVADSRRDFVYAELAVADAADQSDPLFREPAVTPGLQGVVVDGDRAFVAAGRLYAFGPADDVRP